MKNQVKNTLSLLLLTFSLCAQTQNVENNNSGVLLPNRTILKQEPFQFIDHTFMLNLERINKAQTSSVDISLGVVSYEDAYSYGTDQEEFGIKAGVQLRRYVNEFKQYSGRRRDYFMGLYAGAFLDFGFFDVKETNSSYNSISNRMEETASNRTRSIFFTPGVIFGIQKEYWDILYIDLYMGGGVRKSFDQESNSAYNTSDYYYGGNSVFPRDYDGIVPKFGARIGLTL